jgi:glucans biosynthesis protein
MIAAQSTASVRRAVLVALAGACLAGATPAEAAAFGFKDVDARARQLAAKAFVDRGSNLHGAFEHLAQGQYQAITFRPSAAVWHPEKLPFALQFFHEGWRFDRAVAVNELSPRGVRAIAFDAQSFDYGASRLDPAAAKDLGFAGVRVLYALNAADRFDEVLSFLGASYFRALGSGQFYGLSARGLAVDTAQPSGEEFPRFVEFWVERPAPKAKQLTLYALLDSPRAAGAYRFVVHPGVETIVDVTARLYLRERIDKLGLAPLTSMFFYGANQHGDGADYRPEVHDSEGLSVQMASGEWIWRPLVNPKRLLVTSFAATHPLGFGLMQRCREFGRYDDLQARYDAQPSGWVEPVGDWGTGRVELVEIPTPDETNDNIVAYWVADRAPQPGQPFEFAYRIHWQKDADARPSTAWVAQTLRGDGYPHKSDGAIGLTVDFAGPLLDGLADDAPVGAEVTADANGVVLAHQARVNRAIGGWRLSLRLKHLDEGKPVELRAALRSGDKESETWSYILPGG